MPPEDINGRKCPVAHIAADVADVFGHVPAKRNLVCQSLAARVARRTAQVAIVVSVATLAGAVRFPAHAANESAVNFN